jgi:hypothetical protein
MKRKNITRQVAPLYRAAFNGETMPKGWRVYIVERITSEDHARGNSLLGLFTPAAWHLRRGRWRREPTTILLSRRAWRTPHGAGNSPGSGWLGVLIHEWIHGRCRGLKHGAEFNRLVAAAYARVWND